MERLLAQLEELLGRENVYRDQDAEAYKWDALGSGRGFAGFDRLSPQPLAVVRPAGTEEVSAIVRLAGEHRVALVPFGGGSGLMGGAVAVRPSIVIDLARMDRVLAIDADDMTVTVQAGIILQELEEELAKHGVLLGHDPWTVAVATVGGAISTNSLGYRGARYGSMGDHVLGLTAVLPGGRILHTGGSPKASVGPDLARLFIGGEGCFGIVTEATLRVFPQPETRSLRAYEFPLFERGFAAVVDIERRGLTASLLDYGEGYSGGRPEACRLYTGFEGLRDEVRAHDRLARETCLAAGGRELPSDAAKEFWEHRHDIGNRYAERRRSGAPRASPIGARFDFIHVALPASRVPAYHDACLEIIERHGLAPIELGVWCRPQLFSAAMAEMRPAGAEGSGSLAAAVDEMLTLAQDWGGSMEYCHGVGLRLAHLMKREHGAGLEVLRAIKRALDPHDIMNPGKLGL